MDKTEKEIENERYNKLRDKLMDGILQPATTSMQKSFREFLEENLEKTEKGYVGDDVYNQYTKLEYILPEIVCSFIMSGLVTVQEPMLNPEMHKKYIKGELEGTAFYEDTKAQATRILTKALQLIGLLDRPEVSAKVHHIIKEKPTVV